MLIKNHIKTILIYIYIYITQNLISKETKDLFYSCFLKLFYVLKNNKNKEQQGENI